MWTQRSPWLPSISVYDRHELSPNACIRHTSEALHWPGLVARYYSTSPAPAHAVVPGLDEDVIMLHLAHPVHLSGTLAHRFPAHWVQPGDLYLLPRGTPSEWSWKGHCELLHLHLCPALLTTVAQTLEMDPARVAIMPGINLHDPLIHQIGVALLGELQHAGAASTLYVESLTQTLAVHLLRSYTAFPSRAVEGCRGLPPHDLQRVVEYIHEHLAHDLTLTELAGVVHLSPYYFTRLFRQSTGQSVHQYVITQRVDAAKRLLANHHLSIAEVAMQTGFADQSHLSRHFKQRVGISPGAFAAQRKNVQDHSTKLQDSNP